MGYVERWIGKHVDVILEKSGAHDADDEVLEVVGEGCSDAAPKVGRVGTSSNYLKIWVEGAAETSLPGTLVEAKLVGPSGVAGIDARASPLFF